MPATLNAIEVVSLFVDDIATTKAFYRKVFEPEILFEDEVSAVLQFNGAMINLLQASEAPELVAPRPRCAFRNGAARHVHDQGRRRGRGLCEPAQQGRGNAQRSD